MTKPRPIKLKYIGTTLSDGRPERHLSAYGIPPETLEGEALDALSADQIKIAEDSGLYEAVRPTEKSANPKAVGSRKPKAETPPAADPDPIPEAPPDAPTDDAGDGEKSEG